MLSAMASAVQMVEHSVQLVTLQMQCNDSTAFAKSQGRLPPKWPKVAFFATGPSWVLRLYPETIPDLPTLTIWP